MRQFVARLALSFLALALAAGSAPAQEAPQVLLKPLFKPGQDLVYVIAQRISVGQTIVDKSTEQWSSVCTCTLLMRIDSVEPDGSLKASASFKRGDIVVAQGKKVQGYTWGPNSNMDADAQPLAGMGEVLASTHLAIAVDSAGNPSVAGFDDAIARFIAVGGGDDRLVGFFSPDNFAEVIAPIFKCDSPGPRPITNGHQWTTTESTPLPSVGELNLSVDWQLQLIEADRAEYFGLPTYTIIPLPDRPEGAPEVRVNTSAGGVGGTVDLGANMLRNRKQSVQLQTIWIKDAVNIIQQQNTITYLQLGEEKR